MKEENFEIKDIFPNPSGKYFIFTFISGKVFRSNKLKVSLYDNKGLQIFYKEYNDLVSFGQFTFKTGQLVNGTYDVIFALDKNEVRRQINVLQ